MHWSISEFLWQQLKRERESLIIYCVIYEKFMKLKTYKWKVEEFKDIDPMLAKQFHSQQTKLIKWIKW